MNLLKRMVELLSNSIVRGSTTPPKTEHPVQKSSPKYEFRRVDNIGGVDFSKNVYFFRGDEQIAVIGKTAERIRGVPVYFNGIVHPYDALEAVLLSLKEKETGTQTTRRNYSLLFGEQLKPTALMLEEYVRSQYPKPESELIVSSYQLDLTETDMTGEACWDTIFPQKGVLEIRKPENENTVLDFFYNGFWEARLKFDGDYKTGCIVDCDTVEMFRQYHQTGGGILVHIKQGIIPGRDLDILLGKLQESGDTLNLHARYREAYNRFLKKEWKHNLPFER